MMKNTLLSTFFILTTTLASYSQNIRLAELLRLSNESAREVDQYLQKKSPNWIYSPVDGVYSWKYYVGDQLIAALALHQRQRGTAIFISYGEYYANKLVDELEVILLACSCSKLKDDVNSENDWTREYSTSKYTIEVERKGNMFTWTVVRI